MNQQNTNTENYRDDEIDLRKLFQAIGKGFANIGKAFINLIIRIRRVSITYKILLVILSLLGAVAGVSFNKLSKPYYSTSMLLSSAYFNNRLVENSVKKLDALCKEDNKSNLALLLNIDSVTASNIKGFNFKPVVTEEDALDMEVLQEKLKNLKIESPEIEKVLELIKIQNNETYIITVHVFDNTIIGNLEESIVNYFRNNSFVKNRIEATKKNQLALVNQLKNDIAQLDSLKKLFNLNLKANAGRKGETTSLYVGESGLLDPVSFYSESTQLYRMLKEVERKIMLSDDFELVDGFTAFSKPESFGLLMATLLSVLYSIGLAYLIITFIEINKYLNKVEKERFQK